MSSANLGKSLSVFAMLVALLVPAASATSKARIVRLSNVQGKVDMDRGGGQRFERAFLNMPVIEGSKLRTGSDGRAEVEFEDGSVLRIVPDSQIDFTALSLGDDGQKLNTVKLVDGTAYVNIRAKKGDRLTLNFGHESATLAELAHLRVNLSDVDATLAVFDGDVHVTGASGDVDVTKKHSVTFDLDNKDKYAEKKNIEKEPYDQWDVQQSQYHDTYASNRTYDPSSPYAYGISDLNYYGNYTMIPGYGWGWQPFFMDASWSPFMDGGWAWYPGYGYTWVSAYPWGWLPYMYGSWAFAPGYGWFWSPGYWNTWNVVPRVVNPPARIHVPTPPTAGHQTVMVGRGLTTFSGSGIPRSLKIAPGSAGLGVPRGAVQNLDRVAKQISTNPRSVHVRTEGAARSAAAMPSPTFDTVFPSAHESAGRASSRGASPARQPMSHPAPAPHSSPPSSRPPH
jgi:uncharacterized protein DUF6600/FecR-like protein